MSVNQIKAPPAPPHPWWAAMWLTNLALLIAPAVAMQFTAEVDWSREDFVAAAALLVGGGVTFQLACRVLRDSRLRVMVGTALLLVVVVIWSHAAVGIW